MAPITARALARTITHRAGPARDPKIIVQQLESAMLLPSDKRALVVDSVRRALIGAPDRPAAPQPPSTITCLIREEADLNEARLVARRACTAVGLQGFAAQKVVTAVSELARNIARYAPPGRLVFTNDAAKRELVVIASDHGSGIPNLDDVLGGRYRSKTGLGLGLAGTKRLVDRFDVQTGPRGTTITIAVSY